MTMAKTRTRTPSRVLAVTGLVLMAISLRPAVTSLGPVLEEVRLSLGMSAALAGLLTSVPALCFALIGSSAPLLARRWGTGGAIALGASALTLGLAVRPFTGGAPLFLAFTALALAGIALANVLLPVVVKQRFPDRVPLMTGLYSVALNFGASTAAAVTVPLTSGLFGGDWRYGLVVWAFVAAVAVPPWILLARDRDRGPAQAEAVPVRLRSHPVAWALAVYFGLQSTAAYVIMGWLPQIFRDAGLSASTAGLLFAVTSVLGVPLSFALSAVVGRLTSQSWIAVGIGLFGVAGYGGLWAAPTAAPWLWAVLLGVANLSFPLALTMIAMRGRTPAMVVRLSAFAQSTGYLLSIPGPFVVGALYEHSGTWHLPLALMTLLTIPQMVAGWFAGRDRRIG
ncbi:CynX/NimT family MFS transporter [Winogradskya humida]|uniref:MFS transporter n=1 Tax=Winogradskya humida TaxID=113566 RepID=A0ABQ3ZMI4_9ACTN|nr:MFS transporter [Actinoplanes humidus]GIE19709.1 MFS transporter [Actinoplanes humidus]